MKMGMILSSIVLISATGCGLNSAFDNTPRQPSDPRALCTQLKRQIVFYTFNQNHDTAWSSPAQQARILKEFRDNHCDEVLRTDPDSDFRANLPRSLSQQKTATRVATLDIGQRCK
ncbi:MAG: hypothetical protein M3R00_07110, partial [Pseudomonadota bacterium]|nr:hypothetical protein [Pseudomonadota bacterium]